MSLLEARRYVVEPDSEPATPLCSYCEDDHTYRPEEYAPPIPATVRYGGKWLCSFHAAFNLGDLPAKEFQAL